MPLWRKQDIEEMFGPDEEKVWTRLSNEIGAEFVKGGFLKGANKVLVQQETWQILFHRIPRSKNSYCIEIKARYKTNDDFRFALSPSDLLVELGKTLFKMQDIEVGYPPFDKKFLIQGNDEAKVRTLFADQKIRHLIEAEPSLQLTVRDNTSWQIRLGNRLPPGTKELLLQIPYSSFAFHSLDAQVNKLKSLYDLILVLLTYLSPEESPMDPANEVPVSTEKKESFAYCAVMLTPFSLMSLTALSAFCGGIAWSVLLSVGKWIGFVSMDYQYFHLMNFLLYPLASAIIAGVFALIGYPVYAWVCQNIRGQKLQGIFHNPTNMPSF